MPSTPLRWVVSLPDEPTTTISLDSKAFGHWLSAERPLPIASIPPAACGSIDMTSLYRAVCAYLISQLDEKRLLDACESLRDIHSWQLESMAISHEVKDSWSFVPATHRHVVRNEPFLVE